MTQKTPKGLRLHIGIFGRRNAGKSSILNCLTAQQTAIVSRHAGTTTDPVEKPMELLPLGPVLFVDTAGIDDIGSLGQSRIKKTKQVIARTDLAIIVIDSEGITQFETELLEQFDNLKTPVIIAINKTDLTQPNENILAEIQQLGHNFCQTSAVENQGIEDLRQLIVKNAPAHVLANPVIVSDLVPPGKAAVLVVPIDKEAPKGRLILPQVQTIRDLLDGDSITVVCKERELHHTLNMLKEKPAIVVTDSQAFLKVAADTPDDIPMTSFSILFARFKGDLYEMTKGALTIDTLNPGDKVIIAESCTHHPITDDIGTVKIPRWLTQYVGGKLNIEYARGHDFPEDLTDAKLIIHCGACMFNRRQMQTRISTATQKQIPITNYGMAIAFMLGIFKRALKPFPQTNELLNP